MKRIIATLLACSAFVPLIFGQVPLIPKYLDDEEVTRLKTTPEWEVVTGLNPKIIPGSKFCCYRTYVYCKDRIYVNSGGWGLVRWFDLKNEAGKGFGQKYNAYRSDGSDTPSLPYLKNYDQWGWGFTAANNQYLVQYRVRRPGATDADPTPMFDIYPVSQFVVYEVLNDGNHKFRSVISLNDAQYNELKDKVGGPADISSWGDIMGPTGGYIIYIGVTTTPSETGGSSSYKVNQRLAKINFVNGDITGIQYFEMPEINPAIRQVFLKGLSKDKAIVNLRSTKIGIYDFTLNNGAGGWTPEFEIASGIDVHDPIKKGRGVNYSTVGFCAFQMKGPKAKKPRNIFLFPTGAPNYSEKFTGYDIDNYDNTKAAPYEDCYYYAPGVAPSGDAVCCKELMTNYLYFRQDPNDPALGYVYQIRPNVDPARTTDEELAKVGAGNTLRCYKIQILPSNQVFLKPSEGNTLTYDYNTTDENLGCLEINGLIGRVEFKNATIPTTFLNLEDQLSIVDYWASRYDHTGNSSAPYKQEPDVTLTQPNNTFDFTYLSQPISDPKGGKIHDETMAATGPYRIKGYVHYQWYGQVNFKSPVYECDIQPNYESSSAVPVKYKNIWVEGRPYDGGQNINPSKLYVPINFNPSQSPTPVSVYDVYCVDRNTGERILVKEIHGDFDFANKDNMKNYIGGGSGMPEPEIQPGVDTNFPFVCVHEIVADKATAEEFAKNHYYEVETVYGLFAHKVRRSYTSEIPMDGDGVVTSVEGVNGDAGFSVTPTLVENLLNVTCGEGICNIDIYSLSGSLVKHFDGNGNTFESVIVDDLSAGTYFVKVNNTKVVKIAKK